MFIPGDVIDCRFMVVRPIDIELSIYSVIDFQKDSNLYDHEIAYIKNDKESFNLRERCIFNHDDDMKLLKYLLEATESEATFVSFTHKSYTLNTKRDGIEQSPIKPLQTLQIFEQGDSVGLSSYFLIQDCLYDCGVRYKVDNIKQSYDFGDIITLSISIKENLVAEYTYICAVHEKQQDKYGCPYKSFYPIKKDFYF